MKMRIFIGFLVFAAVTLAALSAIPPWRQAVRSFFISEDREILAKVVTSLTLQPETYTIFKIKQKDQIFVEVYKVVEGHSESEFVGRINLSDKRDAFFN